MNSAKPRAAHGSPSRRASGDDASWRPLVDAMPDAVVALDHNFVVMHFNAMFEDLFPRARRRQPLSHVSRNPELNEAVERAVRPPSPSSSICSSACRSNGGSRPPSRVLAAATAGRRDCPFLSFRCATCRSRTSSPRCAPTSSPTPATSCARRLASLRGFVETLQGPARDDPEARERFLGIMSSQANRMTRLIDDLLSLSRVEMHGPSCRRAASST